MVFHEVLDSPGSTGGEYREALIAAAMAHFHAADASPLLQPVPGTDPPLFVALGTMTQLQQLLAARAELTDH